MAPPRGRNNTLVAESDLQAAYSTIQEKAPPILAERLIAHVDRIVEPVTDEAYELYLQQFLCHENNNEFDEDELIDQKAVERVNEIRKQAQEQARRVTDLRNGVLQRAVAQAADQSQAVGVCQKKTVQVDMADSEETRQRLERLKESLTELGTRLGEQQRAVPQKLAALRETVGVVEESLTTKDLSATERAIRQREQPMMDLQQPEMEPVERLAEFLDQ